LSPDLWPDATGAGSAPVAILDGNHDMRTTRNCSGFTLIELMVTLAVVGILLAIAVNTYSGQVIKTRRADGKIALTRTAERLEQCFPDANTYVGCVTFPEASPEGYYSVTAVVAASNYTLTAAPQGPQADDALCASLTLTDLGTKSATGSSPTSCW